MTDQDSESRFEQHRRAIAAALAADDPGRCKQALDDLVTDYSQRVHEFAHKAFFQQLRPALDTQDIAQEVLLKACRWIREQKLELRGERQFLALLERMTRQMLVDRSRRSPKLKHLPIRGDASPVDVPGPDPTGSKFLQEDERLAALRALRPAIRKSLQPHEWHLFDLHFNQGLDYETIAAQFRADGDTALNKDGIRMRLSRIREKLAAKLPEFQHLTQTHL